MLLNNFSGGLSIKNSPHLISQTESVVANNVDLSTGSIRGLKGLTALTQTIPIGDSSFTRFKGQWISNNLSSSYVEFNDVLYMTDSIDTVKKSTDGINFYDVGLDAPASILTGLGAPAPTITFSSTTITGALPAGNYSYMVHITTDLNDTIVLKAEKAITAVQEISIGLSSYENVTLFKVYRLYASDYRYVGGSQAAAVTDSKLDVSGNSKTTTISSDPLEINYVYTYYSSVSGFESAPSVYSNDISVWVNNVTVTGFTPSTDPTVDTIKLYRVGNTLTNLYHVASIPDTSSVYVDTKSDLDVLDGDGLLETEGRIKPPDGLKFLTEYSGALFGCIDSTLYFSEPGTVDVWSSYNFIEFPEHITGFGSTQNGLLVFSRNKTYILTGESLSTYSKFLLHGSQGCITHNTVSYVDNNLLWLSLDGICISTGASIELLSWKSLGKVNVEPITSEVYESQYYLFHDEGTIIIDFRQGVLFYTLDLIVRGAYYDSFFDKLYILQPDSIGMYSYNTGEALTYTYQTGDIADNGLTNLKVYKNFYIYTEGTNVITVRINGNIVQSLTLEPGFNDIKVPQTKQQGYFCSLEFSGTGAILEVEFKYEGRQNGR